MSRRTTRATADAFSAAASQPSTANHIAPSTAMYINSQYTHPAFNKLYLGPNLSHNGKSLGASSAVPKPPKPPEKPLMPYLRYSKKVWDNVKASQPDLKLWEVGKIIGKMWRELPSTDKQLYVDEYEAEKAQYQDLLKSYYNSPAYQGFLQAKTRAEAIEAENRASERDGSIMSIEPADDGSGDTDEGFSVKHVSAARFQRNHRLMQNILLDCSVVPSSRGIVTEQRLDVLCNQVQSLERHQKKLENELIEIEKKHVATKKKWKNSTNKFLGEMKRLRSLTPQEYYAEYKKKQNTLKQLERKANVEKKASDDIKEDNHEEIEASASADASKAEKSEEESFAVTNHTAGNINEDIKDNSAATHDRDTNNEDTPMETNDSGNNVNNDQQNADCSENVVQNGNDLMLEKKCENPAQDRKEEESKE